MLLRFPLPVDLDTSEEKHVNMDEISIIHGKPVANKIRADGRAFTYKGLANCGLALVALVFLLQLSTSPGALAAKAPSFPNVQASNRPGSHALVIRYERGGVSRPNNMQGSSHLTNIDFGHFLDTRRRLATEPSTTVRPLAVKGDRRDPTNNFRKYRAGYDVTSKHYWASAVYTGVYGYAIGVAWLLLGLLLALAACCRLCCCRRERSQQPRSSVYYWLPRILVLLLSLFAIGCLITLFIRNRQLHIQAFRVRDTIATGANDATGIVRNVSTTLSRVNTIINKYNILGLDGIGSTVANLNQQADSITNKVNSNIKTLNRLINAIEIVLIIILAVGLVLVVAGLVSAFLGWRRIFFLIIVFGWILTALTWILFGLFFALNNVTSDTCQAFTEYLQAPANTTLDELLPCVDLATASSTLTVVRQGVSNIILEANNTINTLRQVSTALGRTTSIPGICNPIGPPPDYTYTSTCQAGTVPIGQLPQVVQPFICPVEPLTTTCMSEGRILTPTQNTMAQDFSQGGQSLVDIIPAATGLTNCSFVFNTFDTIVDERCRPARSALRNLWIPLLLLSIGLTFLIPSWILANHRNTQQRYSGIHAQDYSPRGSSK